MHIRCTQPVLERVVSPQTCVYALANMDAQGLLLFAETVLSPSAKAFIDTVTLCSRTDDTRDVMGPSFERPGRQDTRRGVRPRAAHVHTAAGRTLLWALDKA